MLGFALAPACTFSLKRYRHVCCCAATWSPGSGVCNLTGAAMHLIAFQEGVHSTPPEGLRHNNSLWQRCLDLAFSASCQHAHTLCMAEAAPAAYEHLDASVVPASLEHNSAGFAKAQHNTAELMAQKPSNLENASSLAHMCHTPGCTQPLLSTAHSLAVTVPAFNHQVQAIAGYTKSYYTDKCQWLPVVTTQPHLRSIEF